jgi:hypothetical protein
MPFGCHMDRGEVKLTPGPIQRYQIYGIPEGRAFSACSPRNPGICRNWMLHRFDLDCGGVRVSWLSVVAALTTNWMPNRFWVSEGRLHIRMGPLWSGVSDGPCFMRRPLGYGWRDRGPVLDGPCARASTDGLGQVINLPPGFAPIFSFAHFEPQVQPRQADLQSESKASEPVGRSTPAIAKTPTSVLAERPSMEVPRSQSGEMAGSAGEISGARPLKVDPGQDLQGKNREVAIDGPSPVDQAPVGSLRAYKFSADELWFGLTVIVLISAMWLLWRRVEHTEAALVAPREATASASRPRRSARDPLRPQPSVLSRSSILEDSIFKDSDRLPSTQNEALQVLGATAGTSKDVLKVIVRVLRQKWHPDRAQEEERPYRERRLKQINVAWDILRGKQAA